MTPPVKQNVKQAVDAVIRCVEEGFTGSLTIDFKRGDPLALRRQESIRLDTRQGHGLDRLRER